jgi:serine/threonine protein phosphatase PrpC
VPGAAAQAFSELVEVSAGVATDRGHRRQVNEDSVLVLPHVYVVADGMGGHAAGDQASAILVEEMSRLAQRRVDAADVSAVLQQASVRVRGLTAGSAGTTVAAVIGVEHDGAPYWLVANLGDSRTYQLANGALEQVSVDHSVVQELIDSGELDAAAAAEHPQRHVITRAVGASETLDPDYWLLPIIDGARLILCSDGLTVEATDQEISDCLLRHPAPQQAADALVALALAHGGSDNVSVVVLDARVRSAPDDAQTVPRAPAQPSAGPEPRPQVAAT